MSGEACERGASPIYYSEALQCIEDLFHRVSSLCTYDPLSSPQKSNPLFRRPVVGLAGRLSGPGAISFHLPPDLGALYTVSTLAYYLGASVVMDDEPYIDAGVDIAIPDMPELEAWAGETLRRTFYLDCAVRFAALSGGVLNGLDLRKLLGLPAEEVFRMGPGERLLLYLGAPVIPGLPRWHMAAYLDPVPESVDALPFLMRSLAAIYTPRASPVSEREVVSMSIREYIGKCSGPVTTGAPGRHVVMPSLCGAASQLWFSDGFPVGASKMSVRSASREGLSRKSKCASVCIVCNEESMSGEAEAIVQALAHTPASIEILWNTDVSGFLKAFGRGFDVVQVIGHCDERGFKCRDGFASVEDVRENRTPMFFLNSCASYREAALLVERGSACGVATLFRVLEEAAVDVCRDFYRMLGSGYTASVALDAARECSALGKEYLLVGDGSFTCFEGDPLKPFYRINSKEDGYSLGCTMGNVDKGYVVSSWSPRGRTMVSDLGFETGSMQAQQLAAISGKFKGYCLYGHRLYDSVGDAVLKVLEGSRCRR